MAIFESSKRPRAGSRSNMNRLVVTGGDSPGGQWITDPNLPILFNYDYGGPGQKDIVVGKGMLVGVAPQRYYDDSIGYNRNALTIANATVRPFGMAPYNFSQHNRDFLDGNQPSVITREYIQLPLLRSADDAALVKYGAAFNTPGNELKPNDLVTWSRDPQNPGKIIKWVEGTHSIADIIGQVGEIEDDQEPVGWLKWVMWDEAARREDQDGPVNKSGYAAPGDGGYPFDPEYSRLGKTGEGGYLSQYTTEGDARGIPGLTDGSLRRLTVHTGNFGVEAGTAAGTKVQFSLGKKNIIPGSVKVYINNVEVTDTTRYVINHSAGIVTLTTEAADAGKTVDITYRCEYFGTPVGFDYTGSLGAIRILLKF